MKKKAYVDCSADLSIRHQKVAFGFPFSSSSSIFFNGGLRESLKLSYEPTHSLRSYTFSILKQKTSSNRKGIAWKTKVTHKTEVAGKGKGHHGRWQPPRSVVSTTVQPWWPLAGRLFFAPRTMHFAFCLFRGLLVLGYLHWALWSCFLPLMLRLDIKSHIPHKTWPETLKSARKLNKAKTECNRRNC